MELKEKIKEILEAAERIVIIQADNPDADSLGSALAMEQILGDLGKKTSLYCAIEMPSYLRYMNGWDRVMRDIPSSFDASVIVDASTMTLLEKLSASKSLGWLKAKPCVVIDHHEITDNPIYFATVVLNDSNSSSAGEVIYKLAKSLGWKVNKAGEEFIMSSILGDTQGLTNQLATSDTYRNMAEMIDDGVSRPELEEQRRELSKMPLEIYRYKADLINRTEFSDDNKIAIVVIPDAEIRTYSPLYNPAPLIQADILQVSGVEVAVVIKSYNDGKVTGAIRSNASSPIAGALAEHFGGGGHKNASGFKIDSGAEVDKLKEEFISTAKELLENK
jgi:phosphoesterase RecJ-like protein